MYASSQQTSLPNSLLQLINEIIWTTSLEGHLLYANPALEQIYGRPATDFRADPHLWLAMVHPDDQYLARQHSRLLLEQGQTELTYRIVRPDGQIRWLLNRMHVLHDETGQPYQIGGLISDITAQKQTEESLREKEANLAALIENTDDRIWSVDRYYRLIIGNARFGQELQASLGQDPQPGETVLLDNLLPEIREQWQSYYDRALTGERFSVEIQTHFAPTPGFREYRFNPIHSFNGQIVGVIVAGRDTTERRHMETALRVNLEKYRVLFESFPLGITIADKAGQIMETNREASRILNIPQDEHHQREIDDPQWQIVRPDGGPMPPEEYASVRALQENRLIENVEMGIVKSADEITWLSVTAAPLPLEEYGVVVTYGDITPRKLAEKALKESKQQLEDALRVAHMAYWEYDLASRTYIFNDRFYAMLGITAAEVGGYHLQPHEFLDKYVTPEFIQQIREVVQQAIQSDDPQFELRIEGQLIRPGGPFWVEAWLRTKKDAAGQTIKLLGVNQDITERKQAQAVLEARLRLSEFANNHTMDELMQKTLDESELLTGSQIGFFHFLEKDQKTLQLQTWSTNTLQNMCTAEGKGLHYSVDEAGVWADCVRLRRPIVHQDYAGLAARKGMPDGHAPVIRELVVPILRGEQIVAILGVGNKPTEYEAKDLEAVSTLANMAWDIVLRQRAEEKLRSSLREKDVLLKEIHHRVKNNLQFVSSLLSLQASTTQNAEVQVMCIESQRRLRSMALVHEQLYRSADLGRIHFKAYIQDLLSQLRASMAVKTQLVSIQLDLAEVTLPVDTAIPCGLIINELISNALKYAFPNHRSGELRVNLKVEPENWLTISVSDNGVGLPETVDYRQTTSLGLQLVNILTRQLRGTITLDRQNGTTFTLTFPLKTDLETEILAQSLRN